jgi:hypothetical protein
LRFLPENVDDLIKRVCDQDSAAADKLVGAEVPISSRPDAPFNLEITAIKDLAEFGQSLARLAPQELVLTCNDIRYIAWLLHGTHCCRYYLWAGRPAGVGAVGWQSNGT